MNKLTAAIVLFKNKASMFSITLSFIYISEK